MTPEDPDEDRNRRIAKLGELAGQHTEPGQQVSAPLAPRRRPGEQAPWYTTNWARIGGPILAIVLVVTIFLVIADGFGGSKAETTSPQVVSRFPAISVQTFALVNTGNLPNPLQRIRPQVPMLQDGSGRPIVLYVGAEYCSFCAAVRWSVVVTLNRFGTFKNLQMSTSAGAPDSYPDTATFTFYQSTYTSPYLCFQSVEVADRNNHPLQQLSLPQNAIFSQYDGAPYAQSAGSIPFLDIGNQYLQLGSGYRPIVLTGKKWTSIAAVLNTPNSPVTQAIIGSANYLTAAICQLTANKPANVCLETPIPAIEKTIGTP